MSIDSDGSLVDLDGVLRFFSQEAFVALANDPARCFLCGTLKGAAPFNDEHIVPDWILRRFQLHQARVTLPNGSKVAYGQYKLRCCEQCNALLGMQVEQPLSRLLGQGFAALEHAVAQPNCLMYQWLCLLFIKTHLRDRDFRAHQDRRQPNTSLAALYEWRELHHVHTVARAAKSQALIDPCVRGTVLGFEMTDSSEPFDYCDFYPHSTMLVRIGKVGLVAVLNDCGGVSRILQPFISGIDGPLSRVQLREIAARAAYGNALLMARPTFRSELRAGRDLLILCERPNTWEPEAVDRGALGRLIQHFCADMIRMSYTPEKEALIERLGSGDVTLLYNDSGAFMAEASDGG
jgi:hypothetical protein